jgi:hypothetical protein
VRLQLRPLRVLEDWCARLSLKQGEVQEVGRPAAVRRVVLAVREALYRDLFVIPLYMLVFLLAARMHASLRGPCLIPALLPHAYFGGWGPWVGLTALADVLESVCHLRLLRSLERASGPRAHWARLGQAASAVKFVGLLGGLCLLGSVFCQAVLNAWGEHPSGWRTSLSLLGALGLVIVLFFWLLSIVLGAYWSVREPGAR